MKLIDEIVFDDIDIYEELDLQHELDKSENLFKEAKESYNKIDDKLIEFIGNFVVNQNESAKQKKELKELFFFCIMAILVVVIITPLACINLILEGTFGNDMAAVGVVLGAIVEVLTTVIVLPKIVAEYLFNKTEEEANLEIVKLMRQYSEMIRSNKKDAE